MPEPTWSLHWIADSGFRGAVAEYLERERRSVDREIAYLAEFRPFRRGA
jgi:predicted N-acyltransferase